jgi:Protein of unknown function (DUF2738)
MGKRQILYKIEPENIRFTVDLDSKKKPQSAFRIGIEYNSNGKHVPLILAPNGCKFHSFGMQKNQINNIYTGSYSMCLCINYKNKSSSLEESPEEEFPEEESPEEEFCAYIHTIFNECKRYLVENKDELGIKYKDDESFKQIFKSPLKKDIENNNKNPNYHHFKIYPKMIMNKDAKKIWTELFDIDSDEKLDPWDLENVHVRLFPAILFDSIFISLTGPSLQCKLSEAIIERIHQVDEYLGPSLNKSLIITDDNSNI